MPRIRSINLLCFYFAYFRRLSLKDSIRKQLEAITYTLYGIGIVNDYIKDNQISQRHGKCYRVKQPYATILFFIFLAVFNVVGYFIFGVLLKYGGILLVYITE